MARSWFGGTSHDQVVTPFEFGSHATLAAFGGGRQVRFFDAKTGGNQHVDLLLDGTVPATFVLADEYGYVDRVQLPDGVTTAWADMGDDMPRRLMVTTDGAIAAAEDLATKIDVVEKGAMGGVAELGPTGKLVQPVPAALIEGELPDGNLQARLLEEGPTGLKATYAPASGSTVYATKAEAEAAPADTVLTDDVASGTYVLDPGVATYYSLNLTGNATLAVTNFAEGQSVTVELVQDATGGRVVTLPETWVGEAETTLSTTANTLERIVVWLAAGRVNIQRATDGPFALPWTPAQLADGLYWLDGETIAGNLGEPITEWPNSYDSGYQALGATSAEPTLALVNGAGVADFSGAQYLGGSTIPATITQPVTIAALVKTDAAQATAHAVFGGSSTGTSRMLLHVRGSASGSTWALNAGTLLDSAIADNNGWTIVIAVVNGASSSIKVDAAAAVAGNAGAQSQDGVRIGRDIGGSSNYLAGQIAELIVVNHAADAAEVDDLYAWLDAKRTSLGA